MGTVNIDMHKKDRVNEEKYPLSTVQGVEQFLSELPKIKESRFFRGDLSASDLLMDMELALKQAGLSGKQAEALHYVFTEDLTLTEAGKRMGIVASMVSKHRQRAIEKIAEVFAKWGYEDEL